MEIGELLCRVWKPVLNISSSDFARPDDIIGYGSGSLQRHSGNSWMVTARHCLNHSFIGGTFDSGQREIMMITYNSFMLSIDDLVDMDQLLRQFVDAGEDYNPNILDIAVANVGSSAELLWNGNHQDMLFLEGDTGRNLHLDEVCVFGGYRQADARLAPETSVISGKCVFASENWSIVRIDGDQRSVQEFESLSGSACLSTCGNPVGVLTHKFRATNEVVICNQSLTRQLIAISIAN